MFVMNVGMGYGLCLKLVMMGIQMILMDAVIHVLLIQTGIAIQATYSAKLKITLKHQSVTTVETLIGRQENNVIMGVQIWMVVIVNVMLYHLLTAME